MGHLGRRVRGRRYPGYVGGDPANGFTEEFDEFGAAAGFGDGQGVYDFVWGPQWAVIDKGGDGWACMKRRPITPGNPATSSTVSTTRP